MFHKPRERGVCESFVAGEAEPKQKATDTYCPGQCFAMSRHGAFRNMWLPGCQ